jgi:outer membrane immunogenic protein
MKKILVAGLTAAAFCCAPAFAADMPTKAPVYKAAAPAAETWTGFYTGIGVGARWLDPNWTTTAAFNPIGDPTPFTSSPTANFDSTAFRVSGYAGYNWQVSPVSVVGIEGDFGWAGNRRTIGFIPGIGPGVANSTQVKGDWDASIRGRAGYLINPTWMAYVTGGAAFQNIDVTATCISDVVVCVAFNSKKNSKTQAGWTVGGGLEGMLMRNWLARIEYRYSDFGSSSFTALPFVVPTSFGANARLSTTSQIVTVGLAYKW